MSKELIADMERSPNMKTKQGDAMKPQLCENCETEIDPCLGCECGDYEPGFDKVAHFVEKETGYQMDRS